MKNISLKYKTAFTIAIALFFLFILDITVDYHRQKRKLEHDGQVVAEKNNKMISDVIDLHVADRQAKVDVAMNLAHSHFYHLGQLVENPQEKIELEATNQFTQSVHKVSLNTWTMNHKRVHLNYDIVDTLRKKSVETVSIFQKIDSGFIRISTNVMTLNGNRAVGTFIPYYSPVVYSIESGKPYRGRAFVVNAWYLTSYEPIYIGSELKGILYVGLKEIDFSILGSFFEKKIYKSESTILVDSIGRLISKGAKTAMSLSKLDFFVQIKSQHTDKGHFHLKDQYGVERQYTYLYNKTTKSYIINSVHVNELFAPLANLLVFGTISSLVRIFLVSLFLILFLAVKIFRPIDEAVAYMKKLSSKQIGFRVSHHRSDEIGKLYDSINEVNMNIEDIVREISETTIAVSRESVQLSEISQEITKRANEQAVTTEEIASSMEEMFSTICSNTENADQTGRISEASLLELKQSQKIFRQTIQAVLDISDRALVITDFAVQTRILSLNASIEAARAGSVGTGFAVVAQEIGKLAEKSKSASLEIDRLSQKGHDVSKLAIDKVGELIQDTSKSAELLTNIVTVSHEQQEGAHVINTSLQMLSEITNRNSATAEEMSATAEELAALSEQLKGLIAVFDIVKDDGKPQS